MSDKVRINTSALQTAAIVAITLVALALRLIYVRLAIVDHPYRGDAVQYIAYAMNLVRHHTFSLALAGTPVTPDSFRDPGYSTFLAIIAYAKGTGDEFYRSVLDIQCALSAFSVGAMTLLARRWLGFVPALVAGSLFAVWPHVITQCGYILSETLLGALIAAALLLTDTAARSCRSPWAAAAGVTFSLAALTNAVILPFAPLLAIVMILLRRPQRWFWIVFLVGATLPSGAWILRGEFLPTTASSSDRAMLNLVQGAWPEYHAAYGAQLAGDPQATAIMAAMDAEYQAVHRDHWSGLIALGSRLASTPARSLAWYASKPVELWGWDIGIGEGDIYIFPTYNSPLLREPAWRALTNVLYLLNPFVMLLAAVGAFLSLFQRKTPLGLKITALITLFITGVFAILQSDARYATPYRGLEIVLAVYTCTLIVSWLRSQRHWKSGNKWTPNVTL